jgi:hypothetical protein
MKFWIAIANAPHALWTWANESPVVWPIVAAAVAAFLFWNPLGWFFGQFIHGPSGYALMTAMVWLAVVVALVRLFVWWFNRSNLTADNGVMHELLQKIFEDANASSRLLGYLAIAAALLLGLVVHG